MNTFPFLYFLKTPELKLPTEEFPFAPFCISEIATEIEPLDFPAKKMLGKQAEFIFESGLKYSQRFQIIAANIQIQGATETLGELDYIAADIETDTILHIELACKFYLLDATLSEDVTEQWIGPNRKDRLVDKLAKLQTKQFPLFYREETASALSEIELNISTIHQHYCVKAFLFLPKGFQQHILPAHFQDCIAGYYVPFSELDREENTTAHYALPEKKEWLLPPENLINWFSYSQAKEAIEKLITEKRSPLVYKKVNGHMEKFFVVWW